MTRRHTDATDNARGFPAFPATRRRSPKGGGRTWWARAWVSAVEESALDPEPLKKGRAYARAGHVGAITISPGRIAAPVHDTSGSHRTAVYVTPLTDAQWDRFLTQATTKTGYVAALLDRDIPQDLAQDAQDAGVRLLPDPDEIDPECDCPDWEYPCQHAAALCYQTAWLLDQDPFLLLLLRGRAEHALLPRLQQHNAREDPTGETPGTPTNTPQGKLAAHAYTRPVPPLPDQGPPPAIGMPPELPDAPGIDPQALRLLAADAAQRARDLLNGRAQPRLTLWQDTVRLAATCPNQRIRARLAHASGQPHDLERAARAWRQGGATGLDVLEKPWNPPPTALARARAALRDTWEGDDPPQETLWRNRWTLPERGLQLRYGPDHRWYPYRREDGQWWPTKTPDADPVTALNTLLED